MEFTTSGLAAYGHPEFVIRCDESIPKPDREWLVEWVNSTVRDGGRFADGELIQFGWMLMQVAECADGILSLREPDMQSMPIKWRIGATATLRQLRLQKDTAESFGLGAAMAFPTILENAVVGTDVANGEANLVLGRASAATPDSGWFVGNFPSRLDYNDPGNLRRMSLYELAILCPQLVMFMALPVGTLIKCSRTELSVFVGRERLTPLPGSFVDTLFSGL